MEILKLSDKITVCVSHTRIQLKDDVGGVIEFAPGEALLLRELVGTGWKMTALPALPPQISTGKEYIIAVRDNNIFEIIRESAPHEQGFSYHFNTSHSIIEAIDTAIAKLRDLVTLQSQRVPIAGEYMGGGPNDGDFHEGGI